MNKSNEVEIKSQAGETISVIDITALLLWQNYSYRDRNNPCFINIWKFSHQAKRQKGTCENSMKNPWLLSIGGSSARGHISWSNVDMFICHPETTVQCPNHLSQNITEYSDNWQNLLPWSASSSFSQPKLLPCISIALCHIFCSPKL